MNYSLASPFNSFPEFSIDIDGLFRALTVWMDIYSSENDKPFFLVVIQGIPDVEFTPEDVMYGLHRKSAYAHVHLFQ